MRFLKSFAALLLAGTLSFAAETPATSLLILSKREMALAIVDPVTLRVVAKIPSGADPHEVSASSDGRMAYISNYGGLGSAMHMISVVDLVDQKAMPPIDLGPLHSAHGLDFANGKLYFTAETNKVIGTYDPATYKVDWVLGVGQERTHMVLVRNAGKLIFTSNVNSDSISIIEPSQKPMGPGGPPPGGPPQGAHTPDWDETAVTVGKGPEGFDVSPDGKEIWTANSHDGSISVIDTGTKTVVKTLDEKVDSSNRLKFTPDGKYVLVTALRNGDLAIFDAGSKKQVKRLRLGHGAAGILMRPDGAVAYVAYTADDYVAVIDLKTLEMIKKIDAGKEPDGMAWAVR